jgi:glycosyltransferase involved in cell wall biosynthesis
MNINDSKSATPFFSVVITVYNREGLISRALESLIYQTEKDWEAIIIDDGSTDRTYGKVFPYIKIYPQIRYFRQRHNGCAPSKNKGIQEAAGKFITFLDSDDEYTPGHLASRKVILLQYPSVKFLYGGAKVLGNKYVPDRNNIMRKINLKRCVIGGTFFIEINTAREINGFNTDIFGADADLFDRIRESGIKMYKTLEATYIYHHENDDSVTNRMMVGL